MKTRELVAELERRAMDRDKPVVVELRRGLHGHGLVEVDGIRYSARGLVILTLWKPRGVQ